MSMILHYSPGAASLVVHLALLELALPHELKRVDLAAGEQHSAEYLRLNPYGKVPCLVLDGKPMVESAAMLLLLADRHPEQGFAPEPTDPRRIDFLAWLFHLSNTLQPAFQAWFYPQGWVENADQLDAVKAAARQRIESEFAQLDHYLARSGGTITGQYSVADMLAVMLMRWSRNMPKPATSWPHLSALADQVRARAAWRELYAREGLTEWA